MFSWRIRRQFLVFLIIALPFAAIGFYFVKNVLPQASCFDNRQNQGELGVDCGGPCIPCELKTPKKVELFWARAVLVKPNFYDLVAFVRNPNSILVSPKVEYEFALFDEFGLVSRKIGETFLLADERLHVIEPAIETKRIPTRVEFKVTNASWELKKEEQPNLIVERREYKIVEDNGRRQSVVEASIFNRSLFNLREVEVFFSLTDRDGNTLGVNKVLLENLDSDRGKIVKSIWPEELRGEIVVIDVEPRVNVFDSTVILKPR